MNDTKRKITMRITALFSALLITLSYISCSNSNDGTGTNTDTETSADTSTEIAYVYPEVDFKGYEFKILNYNEFFNCYMRVDIVEQTGETVDDAVWSRNRLVESKLNVEIVEAVQKFVGWGNGSDIIIAVQQSVLADDGAYDAAYLPLSFSPGIITDGYLVDLYTVPELRLNENWWDTKSNKSLEINGKLFAATSPLQLMSLDLSWVLLFNRDMMNDNKLDYPYQLVRDGKWTLDAMNEYATALTSLNGDDSFAYSENGNAVYAVAGHTTAPYMMILACGNSFIKNDKDNNLYYAGADDRLYDSLDKIKGLLNVSAGNVLFNSLDKMTDLGGYYNLFHNNRAAFLTTELKGTLVMRDFKSEYGILPAPKYDENQANYITYASENIARLVIPKTNDDLTRTGVILDALSYESMRSVLPLYYNQTISQKGLRDADSIEMLEIINESRMTEVGLIFGLTTTMVDSLKTMVINNEDKAASIIATNENEVKEKLAKLLEAIK